MKAPGIYLRLWSFNDVCHRRGIFAIRLSFLSRFAQRRAPFVGQERVMRRLRGCMDEFGIWTIAIKLYGEGRKVWERIFNQTFKSHYDLMLQEIARVGSLEPTIWRQRHQ